MVINVNMNVFVMIVQCYLNGVVDGMQKLMECLLFGYKINSV